METSTNISMEDVSRTPDNMDTNTAQGEPSWWSVRQVPKVWRWSFRQVTNMWRWGSDRVFSTNRGSDQFSTIRSPATDYGRWEPNRTRPTCDVDYWEYWSNKEKNQKPVQEPKEKADTRFKVLDVDLKKLTNKFDHNTFRYEHDELVVRRGQPFTVIVQVDKKFKRDEDVIKLQFVIGMFPRESKNTMFLITPGEANDPTRASAVIEYIEDAGEGSNIRLSVNFPCDAPVGRFTGCIRLLNKDDKETGNNAKYVQHKLAEQVIVLFNPWCEEDTVYLADKAERDEYVLNQSGQVFVGQGWNPRGRSWIFGQFDKDCLDAALYILDNSTLPYEAYGNPVRVSRCLSSMVNSCDSEKGILTGNWSGDYTGGTSPTKWNGSVRILEEYMKTKRPVKFGQCWVFSGVSTTVCRALGIPARSVTNFSSAHDTDLSMTIDYHVDENGEPIKNLNDSVWNFHVWNEAWFTRTDLPDGYGGWQAFDATPQEQSDNIMQCGPAPVIAIKEGNVHLGYDTKFIFGEVNGDSITWEVNAMQERKVVSVDPDKVGKSISTKAVGKRERLDVTDNYKYKEGTVAERNVAKIVSQLSSRRKGLQEYYKTAQNQDVKMSCEGSVTPQADVNITFNVASTANEPRTVSARVTLVAKYYTGADGETIDRKTSDFNLTAAGEDKMTLTLKAADWLNRVDEDATIGVYVVGKVKETGQAYIHKDSYDIDKPSLELTVKQEEVKRYEPFEVSILVMNPLEIPLTDCSFLVEGAGIPNERTINIPGSIPPGETVTKTIKLTPKMLGEREVIASFHSRQLTGIFGAVEITVVE